jgi:mono/diheme cytochrome c family protein
MRSILSVFLLLFTVSSSLYADSAKDLSAKDLSGKDLTGKDLTGKKVFETYCWGCHHQTAVAFGPSFAQIASQRTADEIRAMITDPAATSKVLGYKRNAMPPFILNEEELKLITAYILSFKESDTNSTQELNGTLIKESYPNIASNKENK